MEIEKLETELYHCDFYRDRVNTYSVKTNRPFMHHMILVDNPKPRLIEENYHYHDSLEIHYVLSGEYVIEIDGVKYSASEGDIIVINPGCLHCSYLAAEKPAKAYRLIMQPVFFSGIALEVSNQILQPRICDPFVTTLFDRMVEEVNGIKPFYLSACMAYAAQLVVYLYRNYRMDTEQIPSDTQTSAKVKLIKNAIQYINLHYQEQISLDELAKELGYTRCHFSHVFTEITGVSAKHYLLLVRCAKAKAMLDNGNYSIKEVALTCGFSDSSYFSRVYKKYFGELKDVKLVPEIHRASG